MLYHSKRSVILWICLSIHLWREFKSPTDYDVNISHLQMFSRHIVVIKAIKNCIKQRETPHISYVTERYRIYLNSSEIFVIDLTSVLVAWPGQWNPTSECWIAGILTKNSNNNMPLESLSFSFKQARKVRLHTFLHYVKDSPLVLSQAKLPTFNAGTIPKTQCNAL